MQESEFDKFADEYYSLHTNNIRLSGENPEFFAEYKIRDTFDLLMKYGKKNRRILDFGAGVGTSAPYFHKYFPESELTCLDVSEKSLAIAHSRFSDIADFRSFDGSIIPFADESFDVIFAACVFHHIPHSEHAAVLAEWQRVLKIGGIIVIFEHNPFNPLTVRAVNTCPFDENAVLIRGTTMKNRLHDTGFSQIGLRYRIFMPAALGSFRPIERWLYWCPLGAQYYVFATKK